MNKQIMLIDDSDLDNFIGRTLLIQAGFNGIITEHLSAKQALEFLSESDVNVPFPDVILLDISMPIMDGFAFLSEFEKFPKSKRENTKIFVLSSTLDKDDIKRCAENPLVVKFVAKPLNIKDLSSAQIII